MLRKASFRLGAALAVLIGSGGLVAVQGQHDHHHDAGATAVPPPVTLDVGSISGSPGKEIEVPITIKGASGIGPAEMVLKYDPNVLEAKPEQCGKAGPLLVNCMLDMASAPTGRMAIQWTGGDAINGDGVVVYARFTVKGQPGQKSALTLDRVRVWGQPYPHLDALVTSEPGEFEIVGGFPWWWLLLLIPVLLLLLVLVWVLRRKKASPQAVANEAPESAEPGGLRHRCGKCGRTIKIPAAMVGRKFKCPKCGTPQIAN